ncbi:MAG: hypothetical protein ACLP2F_05100 [Steroidobacteraceae bacterium]
MQSSLSWIEWFDRLHRVLDGARQDVRSLARLSSPHALAAVERCKRQLSALTNDLRLLDRSVLPAMPETTISDRAENLQKALDTTVLHLGAIANAYASTSFPVRERLFAAVDSDLRDSCYEAAMLLGPSKRRA